MSPMLRNLHTIALVIQIAQLSGPEMRHVILWSQFPRDK